MIPQIETFNPNLYDLDNPVFFHRKNMRISLEDAIEYANNNSGLVLTMNEIIRVLDLIPESHPLRTEFVTPYTEESVAIDTNGVFYEKGTSVIFTINAGGFLTPQRIKDRKSEIDNNWMPLRQSEVDSFFETGLIDREKISMYKFDEIDFEGKKELHENGRRFGVIAPLELIKRLKSGYNTKDEYTHNPLAVLRTSSYGLAKSHYENEGLGQIGLGCIHRLEKCDPVNNPKSTFLTLYHSVNGSSNEHDGNLECKFVVLNKK